MPQGQFLLGLAVAVRLILNFLGVPNSCLQSPWEATRTTLQPCQITRCLQLRKCIAILSEDECTER